jgi:hypothetical protein
MTLVTMIITLFLWYGIIIKYPLSSFASYFNSFINSFGDYLIKDSSNSISTQLSLATGKTFSFLNYAQKSEFILTWIILLVAIIGITYFTIYLLLLRFQRNKESIFVVSNNRLNSINVDATFIILGCACVVILSLPYLAPSLSRGYEIGRLWPILLIVFSTFIIIGSQLLGKVVNINPLIIILLILLSYSLCITDIAYIVANEPHSIIMSSKGFEYDLLYVSDAELESHTYLDKYMDAKKNIYSDPIMSGRTFFYEGKIIKFSYDPLFLIDNNNYRSGYLYLRQITSVEHKFMYSKYEIVSDNFFSIKKYKMNKIFDNRGTQIFET